MIDPEELDRLATRAAAGGADAPAAMSAIYAHLNRAVRSWVLRYVHDDHTAEDVTQDVWLKIAQSIGHYQPGTQFMGWLYTTTRNTINDHFRHVQRRPQEVLEANHLQLDRPRPGLTPHQYAERRDVARAIALHIDKLKPDSRTCLYLRFFDGLPPAHTAQIMGKTEGAIRTLTTRSLRRLAKVLPDGDSSAALVEELLTIAAAEKGRVTGVRVETTQDARAPHAATR
ncbi:RNA polymerase sigma factor [Streptomyces griseus]|uniref:RNA polymerase sigma factor n=1 Tax=Streptomyces griseus TaxID=1911 RepID=UPI003788D8BC